MTKLPFLAAAAIAAASLTFSAPASAETEIYKASDTFSVMRTEEDRTCGMIQLWETDQFGKQTLMLYDDADQENGDLVMLFVTNADTLPEGRGRADLAMDFVTSDSSDGSGSWGTRSFGTMSADDGRHRVMIMLQGEDRRRLRSDMASYEAVGFHHGETLLAAFPLNGAKEGIAALEECLASFD
ncbi:hypothetical protein [Paraurantiacibacter namhicola]|uniref:Uncharacterized protein n=1 Tax=Paraurantiacibacter namhicola TaxID=645517 RepID=A0A1C7D7W8_9SPHN|nr:hypothetical protein [Paraurantiacibacter namhicola]ANU07537.1 hypothetical protein A6F65_01230 [Paraurantiacibacter namhicola]